MKKILKIFRETQFHGVNMITDKDARWLFIPPLLLLFGASVAIVCQAVTRYLQSPTYMVQVESIHPISHFPSVTICPEIVFSQHKMDRFANEIKCPPSVNATYFRGVLHQLAAFYSLDTSYNIRDLEAIETVLDFNEMDVETAGRRLTATCEETIIKCQWNKNKYLNCSEIFRMELTADGFCCVFNGRSLRREFKGQDLQLQRSNSQWLTKQFGFTSGLMIAVNQSEHPTGNIDLSYKWVALQTSNHFVDTSVNGTALNPGTEQWIGYFTRPSHIAEVARALSVDLRGCRMYDEPLTYFPHYNRKYCMLECEMATTLRRCGCAHAVHPQRAAPCRARSLMCANHARMSIDSKSCVCPLTCNGETDYVRITSFKLIPATTDPLDGFYKDLDFSKVTVVRAYVQRRFKKTMERWSYYSYLDLFSQLGGVFNVFFGCSVFTVLAVLHFFCRLILHSRFMFWK